MSRTAINATLTVNAGDIARKGIHQVFRPIWDRARDVSPAWDEVRDVFFGMEKKLFENEGATEEHSQWAPLSESYKEWKDRMSPGDPILQLGGSTSRNYELIKELTGKGPYLEHQGKRVWYYATEAKVEEGYLATLHMTGLPHRNRSMPSRPPVRLTTANREQIGRIIVRYVLTGARAWKLSDPPDKFGWLRANPEFG